jgi:PhzF family phenazine biosynthesis protein
MPIPTYIVDSFTTEAFKGNPAGVCILEQPLGKDLMLSIAQELNLSETAFLLEKEDHFEIQYFSPVKEIPLCGHATLASAKILFEEKGLKEVVFITNNNVKLHAEKADEQVVMQFPAYSTIEYIVSMDLLKSLKIKDLIDARYNEENNILMLVIKEKELERLSPDFHALLQVETTISGVLVTSESSSGFDFKSRYFWPWSGGNEDPVTGATHTFMAPYWGMRLGKNKLKSFQASQRTGFMSIDLLSDEYILIKGNAVIVFKGTLTF